VRHPKAFEGKGRTDLKQKNDGGGGMDRMGLLFEGETKDYAVQHALRAIACARHQIQNPTEIYFYADSEDLVQYMGHDLKRIMQHRQGASSTDQLAWAVINTTQIRVRETSMATLHIDRQSDLEQVDPSSFLGTFLDLYIASQARCHVYGIGNFGLLAAKLSRSSCRRLYAYETWGVQNQDRDKLRYTPFCNKGYSNSHGFQIDSS
jgi:hypothetical protein